MADSHDPYAEPPMRRWLRIALFVGSAALAAAALRATWFQPWIGVAILVGIGAFLLRRWWSHNRLVRMLREGDVHRILGTWASSLDSLPHAETMAPLMTATAFAAFGRTEDARTALAGAARGPAWDAAVEHRLFLDVLLSTFEGETDHARVQVARLSALPTPSGADVAQRVRRLREAVSALVRAFEHRAQPGDLDTLEAAADQSPLVHWAMRYAAAIAAIDAGERDRARQLVAGAPRWPVESTFRSFHAQILEVLEGSPQTPPEASA